MMQESVLRHQVYLVSRRGGEARKRTEIYFEHFRSEEGEAAILHTFEHCLTEVASATILLPHIKKPNHQTGLLIYLG